MREKQEKEKESVSISSISYHVLVVRLKCSFLRVLIKSFLYSSKLGCRVFQIASSPKIISLGFSGIMLRTPCG